MRYLLILQSLCAELHGIANWLARQPGNEVLLALERSNHYPEVSGAERILLKKVELREQKDSEASCLEGFMLRAEKTAHSLKTLADGNREPDIILVYSANGSGFNPKANFPRSFVVNYACDLTGLTGVSRQAAELLELMQNRESDLTFTFSQKHAQAAALAPFALDTEYFCANGTQRDTRQIVFWLKDCNQAEYREWVGRIIPLAERGLNCVIFAPNKAAIRMAQGLLPDGLERIPLTRCPPRSARRQLFSKAGLFVSPSEMPSLDMLEAMACAMPVMARIATCLPLRSENFERELFQVLDNANLLASHGQQGRDYVLNRHSEDVAVPGHIGAILDAWCQRKEAMA